MRRILRLASGLPLLLGLAACTGSSNNIAETAFPIARMGPQAQVAGLEPTPEASFTVDRVLGRDDGLKPLAEDPTLAGFGADGRTIRDLLDVEGNRRTYFDQIEQQQPPPASPPPRRPGSSTPPEANLLPEANAPAVRPPPAPAAPATAAQRALPPGTTIPTPQGGVVTGGSAGGTTTTIGPSGQAGTATRDGGTVTLFGPDGSIRTVPVPQR